ncbi:unnamed protein product [Amoebophrya sp. A25]|nr:unnamed protein product [Amoebophrya sp. A25]|eukprot:GSA25T00023231001.1
MLLNYQSFNFSAAQYRCRGYIPQVEGISRKMLLVLVLDLYLELLSPSQHSEPRSSSSCLDVSRMEEDLLWRRCVNLDYLDFSLAGTRAGALVVPIVQWIIYVAHFGFHFENSNTSYQI